MMELNQIKRMASDVMKVGITKVRINKPEEAVQAMTKDDIRSLIKKGVITKRNPNQPSKSRARMITAQKKKNRRKGVGKRKGTQKARMKPKKVWMKKIRSMRKELKKSKKQFETGAYRKLYKMSKGGYFRSKSHLTLYIKEKKLKKRDEKNGAQNNV